MSITSIPFVKHIGITQSNETTLSLTNHKTVHNHIGTMHAAALYALAETQSGLFLQNTFRSQSDNVLPLLRHSSIKYKHPAESTVYAKAYADTDTLEKFEKQFAHKGRATITVQVELSDADGQTVLIGEFGWFVQSI